MYNTITDDERFKWLEAWLFERKWDGTIGRASYWQIAGNYRHILGRMHGNNLRDAIDKAMEVYPCPK